MRHCASYERVSVVDMSQLVGKVVRKGAEVLIIFRVGGKYYPATEYNAEVFETYLHTGDESYLTKLENELEV